MEIYIKKGRAISDNHIIGTSKYPMRVHGTLGKETNLNPALALDDLIEIYFLNVTKPFPLSYLFSQKF
jgi:hypothetical protein